MADKLEVEVTGKSKAEVAHQMAIQILFSVESKKWGQFSRTEYLNAHADAVDALQGVHFDG
jgi:hypothetical protein